MKGIILAGGSGSRLFPLTITTSKQLLPIYDKPMIFYPLCTLMEAGIRDILIITKQEDLSTFKKLLGDGSNYGINLGYQLQEKPNGLAEAFIIGKDFISNSNVAMILGDNLFFSEALTSNLRKEFSTGARIFACHVEDPERYGVIEFDEAFKAISIVEKPNAPKSNYAVTGLYFYDANITSYAEALSPSARGELEITEINSIYLENNNLEVVRFGTNVTWFDTGTYDSLIEANQFVHAFQNRQGHLLGSPEIQAFKNKWMTQEEIIRNCNKSNNSQYFVKVSKIIREQLT